MGAAQSHIDQTHVRIYTNLLQIHSLTKRQELLETLMAGNEYILSAKKAGIYGDLLTYLGQLRTGRKPTSRLPGEGVAIAIATTNVVTVATTAATKNDIITHTNKKIVRDPMKVVGKQKNSEKALSFFTTCLRVLALQEEVALTEELLKKAYKKKSITAHPDKGGSEEEFESVTRAYAYLSEILKLVKGQRTREGEQGDLPSIESVRDQRSEATSSFQHVEPVKLDPKNLNMEAFNRMFEKTRIPDPDDDGYGDWLKDETTETTHTEKFGGKFNRTVFNQMFEDDARKRSGGSSSQVSILSPQQLVMAPGLGLELGREKSDNYTAPANADLTYTDLRYAYTKGSTFSGEVSGVQVAPRTIESYKASRKNVDLNDEERNAIAQQEAMLTRQEQNRQLRAANEHVVANDYFERMKRLVIRDQ